VTAAVLRADARRLPLRDDSVDLVVTSPPYFGLRSYTDGGEHYTGQIGAEASPAEFVDALIAVTAECVRVLKPSGSLFVNLGDKYSSGSGGQSNMAELGRRLGTGGGHAADKAKRRAAPIKSMPPKSLVGIPWRYALRCIDDLGLILRAEIIWSKPNGLPESVQDRVRRSHEQWFHFTLEPQYFSAVDEIREQYDAKTAQRYAAGYGSKRTMSAAQLSKNTDYYVDGLTPNPLGKLPSSVWHIADDEVSLERRVLSAMLAGALTIDEAERILRGVRWTGSSGSGRRSTSPGTAGSGSQAEHLRDTASSGSTAELSSHTVSPSHSRPGVHPTSSSSTTCAECGAACGTSNPSQCARTSCADPRLSQPSTQPRHTAATGTSSPSPTPTDHLTEAACAGSACEPATGAPTGEGSKPPQADDPGSVWTIPTEPLTAPAHLGVDHFAAFPIEFPRRIIQGWSPAGVCTACGEGRRPMTDTAPFAAKAFAAEQQAGGRSWHGGDPATRSLGIAASERNRAITGYACCCPEPTAPTTPGVVLDPFGGTGTTALVAHALGRHGISVDMSADYCRLAQWRTTDRRELARAMRVPKPPAEADGQADLFGESA
jgi:DNA modification methylase